MNSTIEELALKLLHRDIRLHGNSRSPYEFWKKRRGAKEISFHPHLVRSRIQDILRQRRDNLGLSIYKKIIRAAHIYSPDRECVARHFEWEGTERMWIIVPCDGGCTPGGEDCAWEDIQWEISVQVQRYWEQVAPDEQPDLFNDIYPYDDDLEALLKKHNIRPTEQLSLL